MQSYTYSFELTKNLLLFYFLHNMYEAFQTSISLN